MADVTFGYVYEFGAEEEFIATSEGARLDGRPIHAPAGNGLEVIALEATKPERVLRAAERLQGKAYRIRVPGSIAVALCYVAMGRYDGMITTRNTRSVDAAAGQLVARSAGAAVEFAGGGLLDAPLDLRWALRRRCRAHPKRPARAATRNRRPSMPDGLVDWGMAERVARVLSGTWIRGGTAARRSSGGSPTAPPRWSGATRV